MASRVSFENSSDIGVYSKLTNKYCLVASGGSENFYSVFEDELSALVPVVSLTIGQTKLIGRMTVGNSKGLIIPRDTNEEEIKTL